MVEKFAAQPDISEIQDISYKRAGFSSEEIADYESLVSMLDPEEADGITLADRDPVGEARLKEYTRRLLIAGR